jgi:hypothetical protein
MILTMKPSVLHDPDIRSDIIHKLALGLPQIVIAQSLGINPATVSKWLKRKDIVKELAIKNLEMVQSPLEKVRDNNPLVYIERHPTTRQQWGKDPDQGAQLTINLVSRSDTNAIDIKLAEPKKITSE